MERECMFMFTLYLFVLISNHFMYFSFYLSCLLACTSSQIIPFLFTQLIGSCIYIVIINIARYTLISFNSKKTRIPFFFYNHNTDHQFSVVTFLASRLIPSLVPQPCIPFPVLHSFILSLVFPFSVCHPSKPSLTLPQSINIT